MDYCERQSPRYSLPQGSCCSPRVSISLSLSSFNSLQYNNAIYRPTDCCFWICVAVIRPSRPPSYFDLRHTQALNVDPSSSFSPLASNFVIVKPIRQYVNGANRGSMKITSWAPSDLGSPPTNLDPVQKRGDSRRPCQRQSRHSHSTHQLSLNLDSSFFFLLLLLGHLREPLPLSEWIPSSERMGLHDRLSMCERDYHTIEIDRGHQTSTQSYRQIKSARRWFQPAGWCEGGEGEAEDSVVVACFEGDVDAS